MIGGRSESHPREPGVSVMYVSGDEFLDTIYWFRQVLGLVLGIVWGVLPLRGFVGILLFCAISAGLLYLYFSNFQNVDEEEFGGTWELTKEGFMTSFSLFLVKGTENVCFCGGEIDGGWGRVGETVMGAIPE
uniref:RAB5 interacting factor n=1 Tax=Eptatretus burgeri TaxID=7764 RepID=A0A8C4Q2H2_EPTBU